MRSTQRLRSKTPTALALLLLAMPASAQITPPLAEVNGDSITAEDVEKPLAAQLSKLEEQIYNIKRQRVEALVRQKLLEQEARRRGLTVPKLLDAEVTSTVGIVTEEEVATFYQEHKDRFHGEEPEAREDARSVLQSWKVAAARDAFIHSLREKATVVIHLPARPVTRVEVSTDGAPAIGPASAPLTIVEFSDFHCPFCKRVLPTLKQIEARYGDRLRLVFRDFPIERLHPGVTRAHVAARCAHDQGKFWAFHDVLFATPPRSSPGDLTAHAKQVGLDVVTFDQCMASGKHEAAVRKDVEEGARLGVNGTPSFFINGRLVSGAQPLEAFVQIIEDELRREAKRE